MDEVRGTVRQVLQDRLLFPELDHVFRAGIAVFPDERVDVLLFAEPLETGRDDEQFAAVSHRHPGAVDRFVGDPCAVELVALHDGDDFLQGRHDRDVLFFCGARGVQVDVEVVADVDAGVPELTFGIVRHRYLYIEIGQEAEQLFFGFIVALPQRGQQVAQVVLNAAERRHHVGGADRRLAA